MTFLQRAEEQELFRQKQTDNSGAMFYSAGSAGNNPLKLAQILVVFDFTMNLLGWQDKPLANLSKFLVQYQASLDAKYHNDYKEVLIAEEIEKKRAERKGISILQQ